MGEEMVDDKMRNRMIPDGLILLTVAGFFSKKKKKQKAGKRPPEQRQGQQRPPQQQRPQQQSRPDTVPQPAPVSQPARSVAPTPATQVPEKTPVMSAPAERTQPAREEGVQQPVVETSVEQPRISAPAVEQEPAAVTEPAMEPGPVRETIPEPQAMGEPQPTMKTNTEPASLEFAAQEQVGEVVGEINCPSCNATNSADSALCYSCGSNMKNPEIIMDIEIKEPDGVEEARSDDNEEKPKSKSVKVDDIEIELFTTDE